MVGWWDGMGNSEWLDGGMVGNSEWWGEPRPITCWHPIVWVWPAQGELPRFFLLLFLCGGGAHQCINEWMENRSQIDQTSMKNRPKSFPNRQKIIPWGRFGLLGDARAPRGSLGSKNVRKGDSWDPICRKVGLPAGSLWGQCWL